MEFAGEITVRVVYAALMALLGAVFGSALLCGAERWLAGDDWLRGRSRCDSCGCELSARNLVPIVSYLVAGGKCRHCGAAIPRRALGAEVAGAVAFALIGWHYADTWYLGEWAVFACVLLALSFIDLQVRIIPNGLLAVGALNRLLWIPVIGESLFDTLGLMAQSLVVPVVLLVVVLVFERIRGAEAMGGGDIKLLGVMALYLDWMSLVLAIFVGCVLGLAGALLGARGAGGASGAGTGGGAGCAGAGGSRGNGDADARDARGEGSKLQITLPFGPALATGCILVATLLQPAVTSYAAFLI